MSAVYASSKATVLSSWSDKRPRGAASTAAVVSETLSAVVSPEPAVSASAVASTTIASALAPVTINVFVPLTNNSLFAICVSVTLPTICLSKPFNYEKT